VTFDRLRIAAQTGQLLGAAMKQGGLGALRERHAARGAWRLRDPIVDEDLERPGHQSASTRRARATRSRASGSPPSSGKTA
jgi:hypothetical protein